MNVTFGTHTAGSDRRVRCRSCRSVLGGGLNALSPKGIMGSDPGPDPGPLPHGGLRAFVGHRCDDLGLLS